jgi:hypothetical protein
MEKETFINSIDKEIIHYWEGANTWTDIAVIRKVVQGSSKPWLSRMETRLHQIAPTLLGTQVPIQIQATILITVPFIITNSPQSMIL